MMVNLQQDEETLKEMEKELDNIKVDTTSKSSVETFNKKLTAYKLKSVSYEKDYDEYEIYLERYNASIQLYNNYLKRNCTKI